MRTLIIGSNRDYCYKVKDFLEERSLITAVVLSYKEGIDKLFYEMPDLSIIELVSHELSPTLVHKINSSPHFELVNMKKHKQVKAGMKPVLILEEPNQINALFDFLAAYSSRLMNEETEYIFDNTEEGGDLESVSYPSLLANFYQSKQSGVLEINSRDRLKIFLIEGVPVFAEGGDVETALGRMLLDGGKISEANHEKALEIAMENKQRLGEVLVGMGLISPHELNSFLEVQLKEKIIRGFSYTQGTYSFTQESGFGDRMVAYQINLPQLLYDGIKRCIEAENIEKIFFKKEKNPFVELSPDLRTQVDIIGVGPKEQRFIQLLKDKEGMSTIVKTSRLERDETLKLLYFLYLLDLLKVSGVPSSEVKKLPRKLEEREAVKEEIKIPPEDIIVLEEEIPETESLGTKKGSDIKEKQPGDSFTGERVINADEKNQNEAREVKKRARKEIEIKVDYPSEEIDKRKIEEIKLAPQTEEEKKRKKQSIIDDILDLYSNLSEKNLYQLLGIRKEATKEEIKASYFSLVKKFHPDANPDFKKDVREKAEEIFTKITSAYETLSDGQKRREYDSQDEVEKVKSQVKLIYDAELAYKDGESFLKQRRYREAEEKFKEAVSLNPAEAAYIGALAWTKFLGEADKERVLNEVKKQFEKAISMNPNVAENYFYLGNVYKHVDDVERAEANFLKAVQCNPDFIEAKRELRLLQHRKSESNPKDKRREKKFWSSLFKK
jgi:tetratricopeptide (TPR) repeat protein